MPELTVSQTPLANTASGATLNNVISVDERANPAHITQAFVCPLCGSPVIAFTQSYAPYPIADLTLMNCQGNRCPGESTMTPDSWWALVHAALEAQAVA